MNINCVWEHNGNDTLLWAVDFPGAFTRGETKETAIFKMKKEIISYCAWAKIPNWQKHIYFANFAHNASGFLKRILPSVWY